MRTQMRPSIRGRANKVTKPAPTSNKRPTSRHSASVLHEAVDFHAAAVAAAAAHAQQHQQQHQQLEEEDPQDPSSHHEHLDPHGHAHHHHHQVDLKADLYAEQDASVEGSTTTTTDVDPLQDHAHHHDGLTDREPFEHSQRQLAALASPDVTNGPATASAASDPSIHPALQAFSSAAAAHAQFSLEATQDMDTQMQEPLAAAAAAAAAAASTPGPGGVGPSPGSLHTATAAEFAKESGYDNLDLEQTASTLSRRLMTQPGRRLAVQRRKEQNLNLVRRSNVEALLAHVSGQQAASACKNCHKGHGPWTSCVVVEGQMCGSCANCWYNASGARCSFHETNNPQAHQPAILPPAPTPSASFGLPHLAPAGVGAAIQLPPGVLAHEAQLGHLAYDPEAKMVVERAIAVAREATTRKARHLLKMEIAAKQLVLSMLEYEEYMQTEGHLQQHQHQQHQQQHQQHQQQQQLQNPGQGHGQGPQQQQQQQQHQHQHQQRQQAGSHPQGQMRQVGMPPGGVGGVEGSPTVPDATMDGTEEDGT